MSSRLKYQGLGTTAKFLVVYADVEVNGVKHPHEIKVPWRELIQDEIAYEINLATARKLRQIWESEPPPWDRDLPLPGIG